MDSLVNNIRTIRHFEKVCIRVCVCVYVYVRVCVKKYFFLPVTTMIFRGNKYLNMRK